MDIKSERNGLLETISMHIVEADYKDIVKKKLNNYQHKASIPGFRPGKTPFSIIDKMYGKAVLAEELNTIFSDMLAKYLEENKIKTIGQPIPVEDGPKMDIEKDVEFDAVFEIGIQPEFDVDLTSIATVKYEVTVADTMLAKQIDDLKETYRKHLEEQEKEQEKEKDNTNEETIEKKRRPTVKLNQDFFDYFFGKDMIKSEEEFKQRLKENFEGTLKRSAEQMFAVDAMDAIKNALNIDLPDDFLKRWLVISASEKQSITKEAIDADYETQFKPNFKWQLIENKIYEKYNISVEKSDLKEYYIQNVLSQYFPPANDDASKQRMEELADQMLKDDKQVSKQLFDAVYENKLMDVLKTNMKINIQKVDSTQLQDIIKNKNEANQQKTKRDA